MDTVLPDAPDAPTSNGTSTNRANAPTQDSRQPAVKPRLQQMMTADTGGFVALKAAQIDEVIRKKRKMPDSLTYTSKKTGLCYDVRMRYHATVDEGDMHPEDPRRIYFIYKALVEDGLIDDEDAPTSGPQISTPLVKFRAREVTKAEACLVHSDGHWKFIESTESESASAECLNVFLSLYSYATT